VCGCVRSTPQTTEITLNRYLEWSMEAPILITHLGKQIQNAVLLYLWNDSGKEVQEPPTVRCSPHLYKPAVAAGRESSRQAETESKSAHQRSRPAALCSAHSSGCSSGGLCAPAAPQGYPPAAYPPAYPPKPYAAKPPRRGCDAVPSAPGSVGAVGWPAILHVTVLRPLIEGEIYDQVDKSLEEVIRTMTCTTVRDRNTQSES
jgi:hypothetical protein